MGKWQLDRFIFNELNMRIIIKVLMRVLFVIFFVSFVLLMWHIFSPIKLIDENIEIIKDIIIPLVCAYLPIIITYYYNDKIDSDNLKRSLDILERHWQNNCIDLEWNKIEDWTVTSWFTQEYGFIVSNWNKSTKNILELAKKQDFLQGKVEWPENRVKNHFLWKKF